MNSSKRNHRLVCAAAMCAVTAFGFAPSANAATTYYVDGSSGSDSNSGILWSQAYATLYKALSVADGNSGDDIWVAKGTYYPDDGTGDPDNQSLSFDMVAKVPVYGGFLNGDDFGDRDIVANETILSGAIGTGAQNDNSHHVVTFDNLTGTAAVLDGFTVSDGYADLNDVAGGGIFVRQTDSSIIRNCTLKDNFALDHGGGVGVSTIQSTDVVRVQNCRFEGNSSNDGGGIGSKIAPGTINVINCDFSANAAFTLGGGLHGSGGTVNVVNTTFTGNTADVNNANGGGADFRSGADAVLINCLFASNTADDLGGAVYVTGSATTVEFVNCTLSDNDADYEGGGIVGDNSSNITITNGILWGNTDGGAGTDTEEEQLHVLNGASATVTYTCIEELETYSPGTGNTDDDPTFVTPGTNYRLAAASLLIDAGDNDAVPCDEFDVDEDGEDCTAPAQDTPDLDFGVRIVDGDEDSNDDVDMGAYESVPCPWDLDENCSVGVGDLLILLANWDNPYGVAELLELLAAWGPSCQCDPDADVLSLEDELADACLTQDDWDEYEDVMTDPLSSQADKDRYDCWMTHYMMHCDKCTCQDIPTCPSPDPFN